MAQKTTIFVQSVEKDVDVFAQTDGMPPNSVTVNWFTAILDGDDQKGSNKQRWFISVTRRDTAQESALR